MINPGIQKVVKLLNDNGFITCDSGDGETHDPPCDRPNGYVVVKLPMWADVVIATNHLHHILYSNMSHEGCKRLEEGKIIINGNYDPEPGTSLIDVDGITDKDLA